MSSWGGDWNRDGGGRRDDRGGGYGGGGGGGSRECYKCGKDGHFARECPDSEGGGRGGGGGGGGGGGRACYKCDEEGHIARDCPQGGGYSRGGGGGGGGGGGFSREGRYEGGAARRDEGGLITMMVPNRDLGRIIGKGGCKIRELQDNSSARINIRKDDSDGRETPVDLIGSPDSTSMVKGMIDEVLQSNPRGYGYS